MTVVKTTNSAAMSDQSTTEINSHMTTPTNSKTTQPTMMLMLPLMMMTTMLHMFHHHHQTLDRFQCNLQLLADSMAQFTVVLMRINNLHQGHKLLPT